MHGFVRFRKSALAEMVNGTGRFLQLIKKERKTSKRRDIFVHLVVNIYI